MSATDAVLQNAAYHASLLAQIAELDYVPPALKQQDGYIAGLQNDSTVLAHQITALEAKTKKERKEHEALRDSTTRRFAAKITGRKEKFEAKASKEEREYIEALEKEMQHKRQRETLETMIAEAKAVRADLQDKLKVYNKAKDDLAALYSKIFDGPTQAYPEDDQLEYTLQQAQTRYNEIQGFLNSESQAVSLLQSANSALLACSSQMQEALSYSQWDMFGGGAMSDMMERNALSSAEGYATQAQIFVQQAMMASPQVLPIGDINIAHGSIMSDVIFDNIFTDMAFHDKIKNSARNVQAVQLNLTNQLALARSRAGAIGADLNQAADALTRARGALDAFRRSVFDNLSGGGGDLPAYTFTPPAGPPPGQQRDVPVTMPQEPVMMPRGPEETTSSYAPPPNTNPPNSTSPPPPLPPTGSYAPPPGPPPPQIQHPGPGPEAGSYTPPLGPPSGGSRAASPSAWGSRNPYAAALAKGQMPAGGETATPTLTPAPTPAPAVPEKS